MALGGFMVYSGLNKEKPKKGKPEKIEKVESADLQEVADKTIVEEVEEIEENELEPEKEVVAKVEIKKDVKPKISLRKNNDVKPVKCNIVYKAGSQVITPTDMVLYDYFQNTENKYYFSATVNGEAVLVDAFSVIKEKCDKAELAKAFAFAKECRGPVEVAQATPTSVNVPKKMSRQEKLLRLEIDAAKESIGNCDKKITSLERHLVDARRTLGNTPRYLYKGRQCNYSTCPDYSESRGLTNDTGRSSGHKRDCKDQSGIRNSRFSLALGKVIELKKKIAHEERLKSNIQTRLNGFEAQLAKYR